MNLTVTGMQAGAGTHKLKTSVSFSRGAEGRYAVSSVTGTTVTFAHAASERRMLLFTPKS